jgi:cellulose synthase/poly-beta-1,6-N-acetylglucosamine synthase-like glycosyltransferase
MTPKIRSSPLADCAILGFLFDGRSVARGDVLAFVDADTIVPPYFLDRVAEAMGDPACIGGSADIVHTPASKLLRAHLGAWCRLGGVFAQTYACGLHACAKKGC